MLYGILHLRWPVTCTIRGMLGWTILFASLAAPGAVMTLVADPAAVSISLKLATLLFGTLFLVCILTRIVRGHA